MKILNIVAHPNPESFVHALAKGFEDGLRMAGHEVRQKDLYTEGFDPVLTQSDLKSIHADQVTPPAILQEQNEVSWADALAFFYPLWWYDRPAILKGWIDRVFQSGFAYDFSNGESRGKLGNVKALVVQTTGEPKEKMQSQGLLETAITPMTDGTLRFCGIMDIEVRVFYAVGTATEEQRSAMINETIALGKDF